MIRSFVLMLVVSAASNPVLPPDYASLYTKAVAENRPLIVWVGVVRPDIEAARPDALHLRCAISRPAAPCVVVSRPAKGELWRIIDLPATPRIRFGRRCGASADRADVHIQVCLSIEISKRPIKPFSLRRGSRYHWSGLRGSFDDGPGGVRRAAPISLRSRWRTLASAAADLLKSLSRPSRRPSPAGPVNPAARPLRPLARLRLTDQVSHTLFDEFAAHRAGARGDEETGWVLLGLREGDNALALATLPAGAGREAGQAHVRFNASAQRSAAGRSGSMTGDCRCSAWSTRIRAVCGTPATGISAGTANGSGSFAAAKGYSESARPIVAQDRPMPWLGSPWHTVNAWEICAFPGMLWARTIGPIGHCPLRSRWAPIWPSHCGRCGAKSRNTPSGWINWPGSRPVTFGVLPGRKAPALAVEVPLADPGQAVRILLEGKEVRYYLVRDGEPFAADIGEVRVDQGFYLVLAELAARD